MSVDGFLMGNLGLSAEMSSAQMASQSEHLAKKESEIKIKDLDEAEKDGGVKRKSEEEDANQEFNDGFKQKKEESEADDLQLQDNLIERDFENGDPNQFSIRINSETEMVELLNNKNGKIVESINAEDLMQVISRLDNASGILVNRKI